MSHAALVSRALPSLAAARPDLLLEADGCLDDPDRDVGSLSLGSGQKVLWVCLECAHRWPATVADRARQGTGCPQCASRARGAVEAKVPAGRQSAAELHPHLVAEFVENLTRPGVGLDQLLSRSNDRCVWQCQQCPHRWEALVVSRTRPAGCRKCADAANAARRTTPQPGEETAAQRKPHLLAEFLENLTRPGLGPDRLYPYAEDRCRWSCPRRCPSYETTVASRANGAGCSTCGRRRTAAALRRPKPGRALAQTHPEIAEQWVENLTTPGRGPEELMAGSSDRCVWSCRHGHVWPATVDSRARVSNGCARCSTAGQSRLELEVAELLRASTGAVVRTAVKYDVGRRRRLVKRREAQDGLQDEVWEELAVEARTWTIDIVIDLPDDSVLLIDLDPLSTHQDATRDLRKAIAFEGEGYLRARADTLPSLPAPAVVVAVHAPTGHTPAWTWVQALAPALADVGLTVAALPREAVRRAVAAAGRQWVVRKGGASNPSAHDVRPDLSSQFVANVDRPGLGLDLLPPTSEDECSWWCEAHEQTWSATVKSRVGRAVRGGGAGRRGSGCPSCTLEEMTVWSRALALPAPAQSLAERFPALALEFRGCLDRPELTASTLACTSTYLCSWWCEPCQAEYPSTPGRRTRGKGCRTCGHKSPGRKRRMPAPGQSMAERFPHLVAEFLQCPSRPDDGPHQIAASANVAIDWRCREDGYEWSAPANDRARGQGCFVCGRRRTEAARARPAPEQSLADLLPDLAAQWAANETHPGRGPGQLRLGSGDRCVWRCGEGHADWPAVVSSRARGSGCPSCARQQAARTRAAQRKNGSA